MRYLINLIMFLAVLLTSCKSKVDDKLEQEMIKILAKNNIMLENANYKIHAEFKDKISRPEYRYKAEIWYAKILKADTLCDIFLNELKKEETTNKINVQKIDTFFSIFNTNLLGVDTMASRDLKEILTTEKYNLNPKNSKLLLNYYANRAGLNINFFLNWCSQQLCCADIFYDDCTIISQNSTHFKSNEKLEITAGVGCFSKAASPVIKVDNKAIFLNSDGVAVYQANVGTKKGKFIKKVSIVFTNKYKQKDTAYKQITYTVD